MQVGDTYKLDQSDDPFERPVIIIIKEIKDNADREAWAKYAFLIDANTMQEGPITATCPVSELLHRYKPHVIECPKTISKQQTAIGQLEV